MIKRLFLILTLCVFFISCATVSVFVRPDWISTTPKISGAVMYVGHGISFSEEGAKDDAYKEILDKIGKDLGYEIGTQYFRQLMSTDSIESLSTEVSDHYVYQETNGEWHYYVLARTSAKILENSRSQSYVELLQREDNISKKLSDSISLYKENRDVDAINALLEAIVISLEGDVNNPDYTPDFLLEKVINYAENLRITLSKEAKESIGVTVKVSRTKGLFYPPVNNSSVIAKYSMMDINGDIISSTVRCMTNKKGTFRFKNTNPYIIRSGEIVFSILLDSNLLSKIEEKAQEGFLDSLYNILEEKSVAYSYDDTGRFSPDELLFAIALYDTDGNQIDNPDFIEEVKRYFSTAKVADFSFVIAFGEESEDIYYDLLKTYPEYRYYAILRVGVTDFKQYRDEIYARTEGRVTIVSSSDEREIAVQDSYMVGSGHDSESASYDSLLREARIIAGRLLEEL